jgi:hypothetical protein
MNKSTIKFIKAGTIWNGASLDDIEARIANLPANTVVRMSKRARRSQPAEVVKCTLMLLNKYGIGCEYEI